MSPTPSIVANGWTSRTRNSLFLWIIENMPQKNLGNFSQTMIFGNYKPEGVMRTIYKRRLWRGMRILLVSVMLLFWSYCWFRGYIKYMGLGINGHVCLTGVPTSPHTQPAGSSVGDAYVVWDMTTPKSTQRGQGRGTQEGCCLLFVA